LGKHLTRLFQFAFGVAKKIRTETLIGAHSLSIACIATRLVNAVFPSGPLLNVMYIGAGEMIPIAAQHFQRLRSVKPIFANRTFEKAVVLADKFQGLVCPLADIDKHLASIDVVVTATASQTPLISADRIAKALANRTMARPLLLIDLAVPRDIDPAAGKLPGVYLYTVDDLQEMAIDNRQVREEAAVEAEKSGCAKSTRIYAMAFGTKRN